MVYCQTVNALYRAFKTCAGLLQVYLQPLVGRPHVAVVSLSYYLSFHISTLTGAQEGSVLPEGQTKAHHRRCAKPVC